MERLARIYDSEILPVWSGPFGDLLLQGLAVPPGGQVLDVACATGHPAMGILERLGERSRLIAIDSSSPLLDQARRKVQALGKKNVFFRTESALPRLSFADDVYDLVVCNLGILDMPDMPAALADFSRVATMGGEVRCTLPLAGTFGTLFDLFRRVLEFAGRQDALDRLDRHLARYPDAHTCEAWMQAAGLGDVQVVVETRTLTFTSAQELFLAPVIDYGFLPRWKAVAGQGQAMQDVFWHLKDAVDAQAEQGGLTMTVEAACLVGRKQRAPVIARDASVSLARSLAAHRDETTEHVLDEADLVELTEHLTAQLDLEDLEDLGDIGDIRPGAATGITSPTRQLRTDDINPDIDALADVELDAFVAGRSRPAHLATLPWLEESQPGSGR